MGIQDRDYWRERHWEQQGENAPPQRNFTKTGKQKRLFRIVDKVRVRPDNYVADPVPEPSHKQESNYSVALILILTVVCLAAFVAYKLVS